MFWPYPVYYQFSFLHVILELHNSYTLFTYEYWKREPGLIPLPWFFCKDTYEAFDLPSAHTTISECGWQLYVSGGEYSVHKSSFRHTIGTYERVL